MLLQREDGRLIAFRLVYLYRIDKDPAGWTLSFLAPLELIDRTGEGYYRGLVCLHWLYGYCGRVPQVCIDLWWGKGYRLWIFIPKYWPLLPMKVKRMKRKELGG